MTAMVSVVRDGAVVHSRLLANASNGAAARIGATGGARYVLAEKSGDAAGGKITAKRIGNDLVLEQAAQDGAPLSLVIEDFYASDSQLVGLGADGEYVAYLAVTEQGPVDAGAMSDGASALIALGTADSLQVLADLHFSERGMSPTRGALSGLVALAGGFALSNNGKSSGGKVQPAAAARSFMLEDKVPGMQAGEPNPDAAAVLGLPDVDGAAVEAVEADGGSIHVPGAGALTEVSAESALMDDGAAFESPAVQESDADTEHAPEAGDSKNRARPNSVQTDGAIKAAGSVAPFSIDDVPVIDALIDDHGVIKGDIENGGYTDDGRPQIVGKAEPGVTVHVYDGVNLLGHAIAGTNGTWSFTPLYPLADGRHEISIIHQHPNGDSGEESLLYVIIVDKVAAEAPVILGMLDDEGRITGQIGEQTITDDNRPTINGTAEALATVIIYDKGQVIGRVPVDADGNWSFTPELALADGLHIFTYAAVDKAGNGGERSPATEFIVDTRPEKINIYYAEDDVGSLTDEVFSGGVTDDSMPNLFGTATAGGIVKIYEGSVLLGEVVADVDGTWQFTVSTPLSEGPHSLHATVTLVAKGESAPSKLFKLEVDLTAPNEPTIEQVLDDAGAVLGVIQSGQSTDDATPTLTGMAEKGSTVSVMANGVLLGTAVADAAGKWSFTPGTPLLDGTYAFTISAADSAGNSTASSTQYVVTIDSSRPSEPTIESVQDDVGEIRGLVQSGGRTDDTQPAFSGKAEANSTVIIRDFGAEIGRVQADADGNWSFTASEALMSGAHAITVVSMDDAGNVSAPSEAFNFTVSLVPAVAPSIESIYDDAGMATGAMKSGAVTDDDMPLISGKGEPNSILILADNGVELARVQVDASGNWSYQPLQALSKGLHNLVATEVDAHGNAGAQSGIFGFRVAELGAVGGFENFNEFNPRTQTTHAEGLVYTSGLIVSGTFGINIHHQEYNTTGIRWEDLHNNVYVEHGATARMDLPVETERTSFMFSGNGLSVSYYDVNGELLGVTAPKSSSQYGKEVFQAPPGKFVASIEITAPVGSNGAGNGDRLYIECLQWGERRPTGISISTTETDSSDARIVYGRIEGTAFLLPDMVVQVSTDGGKTWVNAAFAEGSWAAIQSGMPRENWTAEVRIVERSSGLSIGLSDSKFVQVVGAGAPVIVRIPEAEDTYTTAKAADGTLIELSLVDTGATLGDSVHIRWGTVSHQQVLTKADIDAGSATIRMPADQLLLQGASKDFSVTAQIIGKSGAIGTPSQAYEVVINGSADPRDPNLITSAKQSFFGSDASDVVTLNMNLQAYLNGSAKGINGGGGVDTLKIGATGYIHDFSAVSSMEVLDLGVLNNTNLKVVYLGLSDVLRNGGVDAFYSGDTSRVQMLVKGKGGSGINGGIVLKDELIGGYDLLESQYNDWQTPGDLGDWVRGGERVEIDGYSYVSYKHSAIGVELLVQVGVGVNVYNRNEVADSSVWSPSGGAFAAPGSESAAVYSVDSPESAQAEDQYGMRALLPLVEQELFPSGAVAGSSANLVGRGLDDSAALPHGLNPELLDSNLVSHLAY